MWKHLKVDINNHKLAKCDYCTKTFANETSTTNFWRHLKAVHKIKGWHEEAHSQQVTPSHASPLLHENGQTQGKKQIRIEDAFKQQEPLKKVKGMNNFRLITYENLLNHNKYIHNILRFTLALLHLTSSHFLCLQTVWISNVACNLKDMNHLIHTTGFPRM